MKPAHILSPSERAFGRLLHTQSRFLRYFWEDDLPKPLSTRQKLLVNDNSQRILSCLGRQVIKSLNIEARVIRKGIMPQHSTKERMIVTPGQRQMDLILNRILNRISHEPLFKMLASVNRGEGTIRWKGGSIHYARIEGTTGTDANMQGIRAVEMMCDEEQLGSLVCHSSRMSSATQNCEMWYSGVPDGRRDTIFYQLDQTNVGDKWSRHNMTSYANPRNWSIERRDQLRKDYRGQNSPDYVTQVLGKWGSQLFSEFPPGSIAIHHDAFQFISLSGKQIPDQPGDALERTRLASMLMLPRVASKLIALGMDYGSRQDPTEIFLAYLKGTTPIGTADEPKDQQDWQEFAHIEINNADEIQQAYFIQYLVDILGPEKMGVICIDLQGPGSGVGSALRRITTNPEFWLNHLINFNAGGTVEVMQEIVSQDGVRMEMRKVRNKQYFTEQLQHALLAAKAGLPEKIRLWIADHEETIQELEGTRSKKNDQGFKTYLPPMRDKHNAQDHRSDGLRSLIRAIVETANFEQSDGFTTGDGLVAVSAGSLFNHPNRLTRIAR